MDSQDRQEEGRQEGAPGAGRRRKDANPPARERGTTHKGTKHTTPHEQSAGPQGASHVIRRLRSIHRQTTPPAEQQEFQARYMLTRVVVLTPVVILTAVVVAIDVMAVAAFGIRAGVMVRTLVVMLTVVGTVIADVVVAAEVTRKEPRCARSPWCWLW